MPKSPKSTAHFEPAHTQAYDHPETRELALLVNDAAERIRTAGEAAFGELRAPGSRWRHEEKYVFVLDPNGTMLVHPDPALEGKSQLELEDINGKPIIRGLIAAATASSGKHEGWYHYEWPVPGALLPRWKSSYVRLVQAPSGKSYLVGSGMYDNRMERAFVVDMVKNAAALVDEHGDAAIPVLRDPKGPFVAKDAYVFIFGMDGLEILNAAFPNLEGRNLLDVTDTQGKHLVREMLQLVHTRGSGWVEYMWPKPGDSASTRKSAFVMRAMLGHIPVLVGCGVYLADAPKEARPAPKMTAAELTTLVREAAALLEAQGQRAYPELRKKGSKWFRDDIYFFVLTPDATRAFHAADPEGEGEREWLNDALGRPISKMILDTAAGPSGEGWVHYMYPRPGEIFPSWKSTFVKRVRFPSGEQYAVCCGIYDMQMDKSFIEDVVGRAADLVAERGTEAFPQLRDTKGPFVFMDTYVFVMSPDGTELVNPAQRSLEGRNLMALKDLKGNAVVHDEISAAMKKGSAWLDVHWFKPGTNEPALEKTYVRKVQAGRDTFVVGSGIFMQ